MLFRSKNAKRKCLTHFRQLVSKINKQINTPQINQCNGTWSKIDFDKNVTSITLRKQGKAFQCVDKKGNERNIIWANKDRSECSENYKAYIARCKEGKSVAKGKRVSIIDFVRDALQAQDPTEKDGINAQWVDNGKQNGALEDCIAMVDTSGSMESDNSAPLYSAVGLGLRIAEKSKLGKRIMTFSSNPSWMTLNDCPDFVSMVNKVSKAPWGMNTNFRAALDMILDTAISNNISPDNMRNMTLVILSDMQIDTGSFEPYNRGAHEEQNVMFETMKQKYHNAGLRSSYHESYTLPHIVFWNLRPTQGFPSLAKTANTSMMSGNNPALLNAFCNKGFDALKDVTPWNFLKEELSNKRYDHLGNIVNNIWT